MKIRLDFLKNHPLFGGITPSKISKILHLTETKMYRKNRLILKEHQVNDKIFFILKGKVAIRKIIKFKNGHKICKTIGILNEGDNFGEMEVIDVQRCAASIKTLEQTEVLIISNLSLYKIMNINLETYTILILNLAREISRRLRFMDKLITNLYAQLMTKQ